MAILFIIDLCFFQNGTIKIKIIFKRMSENNGPTVPEAPNPENIHIAGAPLINTNRIRNNNNQNPLFNVRDRLFHTLFFRAALAYARTFPRPVRRFLEFVILIKAIASFFVLVYIHVAFSRTPTTCLDHVKDTWPRDGILRVEIVRNAGQDYNIEQSYAKEEKLKKDKADDIASMIGMLARDGFINIEPSVVEETADKDIDPLENQSKCQIKFLLHILLHIFLIIIIIIKNILSF